VKRKPVLGGKLDRLSSACLAIASCNDVAVTGLDVNIAEVLSDRRSVAVRGHLASGGAQLAASKTAGAGECVVSGGQVFLLREEEDDRALLSGVFGWDVEVEDRAGRRADFTKVGCALCDVGLVGRDGDDEVGSLVGAR